MLHLYVPTRGRVGRQKTLARLPPSWLTRTTIVCPKEEVMAHKLAFPLCKVVSPKDDKITIAQKRKWIFEHAERSSHRKIMMLDDDLYFNVRKLRPKIFAGFPEGTRQGEWNALLKSNPGIHSLFTPEPDDPELSGMLLRVDTMLNVYRHGGISARQGNVSKPGEWDINSRAVYALAYHVPTVMEYCELGRIEHREDFDYTLQLLTKGFPNAVYFWGSVSHATGYGDKGGASLERKIENSNRDAVRLSKMFPGLVKVVDKDYKGSTPRKEVIVSWKKAFNPFGIGTLL